MSLDESLAPWLAIGLAAIFTYALRAGGLLLASKLSQKGKMRRFLETLPGALIVALVVPTSLSMGWPGVAGLLCSAGLTWKTGSVFFGMLAGTLAAMILNLLGSAGV